MSPMPALVSLGGAPPPPLLRDDLETLARVPVEARNSFWQVLSASLPEPMPDASEPLLTRFSTELRMEMELLARLVGACRFLLREAVKRGVSREAFATDLRSAEIGTAAAGLLVEHFDEAQAIIARDILIATLADHGRLLTGVSSRLDTVGPSDRGVGSDSPIGLLTLRLQEGDVEQRTSFYVIPSVLEELRDTCEVLLRGMRERR